MSAQDKNSPIVQLMDNRPTDSNHNDNECNKRAIKFLRQNMENSADGSACIADNSGIGNCYRSILIDEDVGVDFKNLQMLNNSQGLRSKHDPEQEDEERRKAVFHRTFCRESFVRKFSKMNLDNESYALINLMFGLKRKSSTMYRNLCFFSVLFAFGLGLMLGSFIPFSYNYVTKDVKVLNKMQLEKTFINQSANLSNHTTSLLRSDESFVDKNETNSRVFIPYERKNLISINVDRSKDANQAKRKKSIKLNRPKKFSSVSFVDDLEKIPKEEAIISDQKNIDVVEVEEILHGPVGEVPQSISDDVKDENNIVYGNIFWGPKVEKSLPAGFGYRSNREWTDYIKSTSAVKMETGCGRMQNRLVTFLDGRQACVRYRQNTDQIQGELFSFYLAQLLNLPNLVPSLVSLVNLTDSLWQNVASDIGSAQWNSNRPVVMTRYIPNLESAHIPDEFKPSERHLNKHDVLRMIKGEAADDERPPKDGEFLLKKMTESINRDDVQKDVAAMNVTKEVYFESISEKVGRDTMDRLLELAQWSDLIVFDYLTANLDRIVNNLYNYQWNVNIMDAPAHNLAKKVDSNLLLFLDNESGLLHGYRLLHKYEIYHSLLLDNLCVFRKSTADAVQKLQQSGKVGDILNEMFKTNNGVSVQDVLPPLPEKSVKILNERISRVASQIKKCQEEFSAR